MPVTFGILLNVTLIYNLLTKTLTDSPSRNRRFRVEEGTDYHGSYIQEANRGAVGAYRGLRVLK